MILVQLGDGGKCPERRIPVLRLQSNQTYKQMALHQVGFELQGLSATFASLVDSSLRQGMKTALQESLELLDLRRVCIHRVHDSP